MTETPSTATPEPAAERFMPAEAVLYRWSPLGLWGTTLAIFVISFGSFALIAELTGRPHLGYFNAAGAWQLNTVSWIGFVLSMILTTGIGLTEVGRRRWQAARADLLAALEPAGHAAANGLCDGGVRTSWRRRYWLLSGIGMAGGLVYNVFMAAAQGVTLAEYIQSIGLWFVLVSPWLYAVGTRAGLGLARDAGELRQLVDAHLAVDLFHLERLDVFGRIGLSAAARWLVMAAVLLLFVADPSQAWISLPAIALAALGGALSLAGAVRPVQRRIQAAKLLELAVVHKRMAEARERTFAGDDAAAAALAGLADYEIWIERRPEWPISTSTGLRFGLYVMIPILPILGSYLFERFADTLIQGGLF